MEAKKQKKETVKIFKKCCGILCGRVAIQKAVEVNYRAVCLEVYFRIPAFSYTYNNIYIYIITSSHYIIYYITQRDLYWCGICGMLWYACGKKYTNF